jgi:hypothetical protein
VLAATDGVAHGSEDPECESDDEGGHAERVQDRDLGDRADDEDDAEDDQVYTSAF